MAHPNEWDEKNERLRSSSKSVTNVTRFNNNLAHKKAQYQEVVSDLEREGELDMLNASQLKSRLLSKPKEIKTVFEYIEELHNNHESVNGEGTAGRYKDVYNKLKKYNPRRNLSFTDINYSFLKKIESDHFAAGNKPGSLSVYLRTLRSIYNEAIKAGYANQKFYPFNDYKIKKGEPQRTALPENDFKKILYSDYKEGSALRIGRDYYLMSYYLQGINWKDMCLLRYGNFSKDLSRLSYIRIKTKKPFNIRLDQKLIDLINAYKTIDLSNDRDFVLPILKLSDPEEHYAKKIKNRRLKINSYLRAISKDLEIAKFSFYTARHTYATMLWKKAGSASVAQMSLGHQTEKQTQEYLAHFGNKEVDDATEGLFNEL